MGPWRYDTSRELEFGRPARVGATPFGDGSCCSIQVDETSTQRVTPLLAQRETSRPRLG